MQRDHGADRGRTAEGSASHLRPSRRAPAADEGVLRRAIGTVRDYIPKGNTLGAEAFGQRHRLLCWILGLHVPALFAYGVWQGVGIEHSAMEIVVPVAALLLAQVVRNRRLAAFFVTVGLVFCSSTLVHLSDGTIEAHFHFFVLIGLIALYQDWVPFLWNVVFTVFSHGLGSAVAADLMYNHPAAQNQPWTWAVIHGVAVLAACVGVVIFWKNTELEQVRSTTLAASLASAQTEAAQRRTVSDLFVNLARRNQSLLDRQLELIAELEQNERGPDALAELFQLDHLATRIRRNAESLLVLSGDGPARSWGKPVPLGEVVRAAAAEVEDYQRVDIVVNEHLEVSGRAVAELAHLLAELIENATTFSPGTNDVRVRSYLTPDARRSVLLSIEDTGIGMAETDRQAANALLADPPEVDLLGRTMGFHVVGRLARRNDLQVSLAHTPGGGITALVTLPADLVAEREAAPAMPRALPSPPTPPPPPAQLLAPSRPAWSRRAVPVGPAAAPAPAPAPAPSPAAADDDDDQPVLTAEGLVRRVPGAGLAPSLRRRPATGAEDGPSPRPAPDDREQMRSMLSRFQASQRAGRAVADAPTGSLAPADGNGSTAGHAPQEQP